jgi:hypothetical protein
LDDFGNLLSHGTVNGTVSASRVTLDPDPAPEPTSLLLFGSGFLVGVWIPRQKLAIKL